MIRILHIIDKMSVDGSGLHGIARAIAWWCERLDPERFESRVLSLRGPEPEAEQLFAGKGVPLRCVRLGRLDPRTFTTIRKEAKTFGAGVLHLHGFAAAQFGRLAARSLGIPAVVHEHVVFPKVSLPIALADRLLAPLTSHALAISEPVATFMREKRHIPADRLETFFYGIPFEEWDEPGADEIAAVRATSGTPADAPVICTVGRLAAQKDLPSLVRAHALLRKEHPEARLWIVGEGPERELTAALAAELGIAESVYFAGFQHDVRPWISGADIFVIPSLFEGGPLTLFEAMRLARPVVSTPVGIVPEALADGETGFLTPMGNPEALAEHLARLLADPVLRQSMGTAARSASDQWSITHSVEKLAAVYERLGEEQSSRNPK